MSEVSSIIEIRRIRDEIREKISSRDKNLFLDQKFGSENEYTYNGIIGGLSALLTDISTLTKAPNRFIKLSTYNERQSISQSLNYINSYFHSPANYISYFESLKSLIRSFNLRFSNERQIEFEHEIDNLLRTKIEFEESLIEVRKLKELIEAEKVEIFNSRDQINNNLKDLLNGVSEINQNSSTFKEEFENFKDVIEELTILKTKAQSLLDEITAFHIKSASNEKVIENFASKIDVNEKKLTSLNTNIQQNQITLDNYQKEREIILSEAKSLIESAKEALNYKTAQGISASFQTQYEDSLTFVNKNIWILLSAICLLITVAMGIWIISEHESVDLNLIIARISLLPFPVFGAIFCGNQYTKQKNISEDYAYKMVIAKSIVGFSEQLKKHSSEDQSEYLHYIKTALEEIHKDPLRTRQQKESKELLNSQKISEMVEIVQKLKNI